MANGFAEGKQRKRKMEKTCDKNLEKIRQLEKIIDTAAVFAKKNDSKYRKVLAEKNEKIRKQNDSIKKIKGSRSYKLANFMVRQVGRIKHPVHAFRELRQRMQKSIDSNHQSSPQAEGHKRITRTDISNHRKKDIDSKYNGNTTIAVIIATMGKRDSLFSSVQSVISQEYPLHCIEIIVVFNGCSEEIFKQKRENLLLLDRSGVNIKILYREDASPGGARNDGVAKSNSEWITFLDDDDHFTSGCFREALRLMDEDVNIVQMADFFVDSGKKEPTYITRAISKCDTNKISDYHLYPSFFNNNATKIYRHTLWREFDPMPEHIPHTEDRLFWVLNFDRLNGSIALFDPNLNEGYCRCTDTSMSRPSGPPLLQFIDTQLDVISEMEKIYWNQHTSKKRRYFIQYVVNNLSRTILNKCIEDDTDVSSQVYAKTAFSTHIKEHETSLISPVLIADKKGISFSAYGVPYADTSAYISTLRLKKIMEAENEMISWSVYKQNMDGRRREDIDFYKYYASRLYSSDISVAAKYIGDLELYTKSAINQSILYRADFIYSRAQPPHSHRAAYEYKKYYPDAKWYAEFSDPISRNSEDAKRDGDKGESYEQVEQLVYDHADIIIFTNKNQMEYMLSYNIHPKKEKMIREKSVIWSHPIMEAEYAMFIDSQYKKIPLKINIAYFGNFYTARDYTNLLKLLKNDSVILHVFSDFHFSDMTGESMKADATALGFDISRLKINDAVPLLEMLNIASKMDYLYLEDAKWIGNTNPYLPSKYASYTTAILAAKKYEMDTPIIIALVDSGKNSILSKIDDPLLLKTEDISDEFVMSL